MSSAAARRRAARRLPRWRDSLSCPLSEQPARADQEYQDEDDENADLPERLAEIESAEALDHAGEQAADQRARDRAHAAKHHDRKGDQHEGVTGIRIDVIGR